MYSGGRSLNLVMEFQYQSRQRYLIFDNEQVREGEADKQQLNSLWKHVYIATLINLFTLNDWTNQASPN